MEGEDNQRNEKNNDMMNKKLSGLQPPPNQSVLDEEHKKVVQMLQDEGFI
jgi:hypothetical protein